MQVSTKRLRALLKFTSRDYNRPCLQGINLGKEVIEATDGYILGWYKIPGNKQDCPMWGFNINSYAGKGQP